MKRAIAGGRRCRDSRGALALVLSASALLAGCSKKVEGLVLLDSSVTASPILQSEAEQVVIPVRIDAPIQFANRSGVDQFVTIAKTGCSCYGMATVDSFLNPGERIRVPAGDSKALYFVAKELNGEAQQAFRVGLVVGGAADDVAAANNQELRAECSMKIVPDLVLDPVSIVVDVSGVDDRASSQPAVYPLTVTRVTRGKPADSTAPNLVMAPELLKAGPFQLEKSPGEVAPGLWRTVWKTSVRAESLPDEVRNNGGRFGFALEFPESGDPSPRKATERNDADGLPTVLDVVSGAAPRQITGQLIVRRSKGIIAPAQLHFGTLAVGSEPRTRRLVLTAADHRPFQVTVADLPKQFEAEVDSPEPAKQQWVTVKFVPDSAGEIEWAMTLKSTHPDQSEVLVRLKARVQ